MPNTSDINRPGALTNPPEHLFDEANPASVDTRETALPTGENTSPDPANEVADPHPSDEGDPYLEKHPGGATPPKTDIGPNPAVHTGTPDRRPDNADHGPKFSPG
jgi:hypothetical protein